MNAKRSYIPTKRILAALIIAFVALLVSLFAYPLVPDIMVTHWDAQFRPDGFMDKIWGLFLIPLMLFGFWLLFWAIPKIDPLKANFAGFVGYYENFVLLIFLFMLALQILMVLWNVGIILSFAMFMPLGLAILFYYVGILCKHAKKNWFVGVRTPWTLSSDRVWDRTNQLAGKLFQVSAFIMLFGVILPQYMFFIIMAPILVSMVYTTVYSYLEYRKEQA